MSTSPTTSTAPASAKATAPVVRKVQIKPKADTASLLQKLQTGEISLAECQTALETNEKSKAQIHFKPTPKGCIGIYNVRRMPISLYIEELERILAAVTTDYSYTEEFQQFLDDNKALLKRKE